jgi:hypothetical protein
VVLTRVQTEYDRDTTALLVCTMYGNMGGTCMNCKTSGTDDTLSFNDLEDLLLHHYITHRTHSQYPIAFHEKFPSLRISRLQK